jgi:dUTP pyrophosphatase
MEPIVYFKITDEKAVIPTRGNEYAVGHDLTIISKFKQLTPKTALYDTGIQIQPSAGYYTEIIPRSSLSKSGYMLSNSIGIIDPDYRGNLLVALTHVDDNTPEIIFPFKCAQLVLRKFEPMNMVRVEKLDDTVRGDGGFGSTGK